MSHDSGEIKRGAVTTELQTVDCSESSSGEPQPSAIPDLPSDGRSAAVWRQWLSSMADDAEAALAAAMAYREMDEQGRESWLSSLQLDAPSVNVPSIALYAPLLAVEQDPARRERLIESIDVRSDVGESRCEKRALFGRSPDSTRVFVLATPLYLNFVQVLACGVRQGQFSWVRHDPIVGSDGVPNGGDEMEGAVLEPTPVKGVLDELAQAVLSHGRSGEELPEALGVLSDLLGPLGP